MLASTHWARLAAQEISRAESGVGPGEGHAAHPPACRPQELGHKGGQSARAPPAADTGAAAEENGRAPAPGNPTRAPQPAAAEDNPGSSPAWAPEGRGGGTGFGQWGTHRASCTSRSAGASRLGTLPCLRRAGVAASKNWSSYGGASGTGRSTRPSPPDREAVSSSSSKSSIQSAYRRDSRGRQGGGAARGVGAASSMQRWPATSVPRAG
ncbi:hypothetical protein ZWY2020_005593 [Hordeum vulgare]|nr:hypothetical protein ZWY2020_005593 [Hordeum vulgare]